MLTTVAEKNRLKVSKRTDAKKKSHLGQYLTPATTASFMAGLFPDASGECRLLDAGAGIGSLSSAFLERCSMGNLNFESIRLKAFEIDSVIHEELHQSLSQYNSLPHYSFEKIGYDFIESAVNAIQFREYDFTHAILNPPYKKIGSHSRERLLLREVAIETVNLYSAFVALALALTAPGGQIVAIIPRSFCNGPYYRPFREFMLKYGAIRHIHLFDSRSKAFRDDAVLQENIIIRLERDGVAGSVTVSTSTDDTFGDLTTNEYPFERIVFPDDRERFIHIPTSRENDAARFSPSICHNLNDLGIQVSTGPVVDFRMKEHLRFMPEPGTVPLLYPGHFSGIKSTWPIKGMKKPNAILRNTDTEKWLYQNAFYCVVRRFSSKEEKRRIMASVVEPDAFGDASMLGFENHLNLFHENKKGLPEALARGLAVYLNTSAVDEHFRRFNGHTQVNATDLRQIRYPSRDILTALGKWAIQQEDLAESAIEAKLKTLTA
ncbi:MAG: SAM-dependent methyltransferase [Chlorobiaceae bacterium]|nr:SAM-dependent methyltransferase [Chlorobiaceae bacterium]